MREFGFSLTCILPYKHILCLYRIIRVSKNSHSCIFYASFYLFSQSYISQYKEVKTWKGNAKMIPKNLVSFWFQEHIKDRGFIEIIFSSCVFSPRDCKKLYPHFWCSRFSPIFLDSGFYWSSFCLKLKISLLESKQPWTFCVYGSKVRWSPT